MENGYPRPAIRIIVLLEQLMKVEGLYGSCLRSRKKTGTWYSKPKVAKFTFDSSVASADTPLGLP
jgi:hypothetical protein